MPSTSSLSSCSGILPLLAESNSLIAATMPMPMATTTRGTHTKQSEEENGSSPAMQTAPFYVHCQPSSMPIFFGDPLLFLRRAWIDVPATAIFGSTHQCGPITYRLPIWLKQCVCVPGSLATALAVPFDTPAPSPMHAHPAGSLFSLQSLAVGGGCAHKAPWEAVIRTNIKAHRANEAEVASLGKRFGTDDADQPPHDFWHVKWKHKINLAAVHTAIMQTEGLARPPFILADWSVALNHFRQVLPLYPFLSQVENGVALIIPDLGFEIVKQLFDSPLYYSSESSFSPPKGVHIPSSRSIISTPFNTAPHTYRADETSMTHSSAIAPTATTTTRPTPSNTLSPNTDLNQRRITPTYTIDPRFSLLVDLGIALCHSLHSWHSLLVIQKNVRPEAIFWHAKMKMTHFHDFSRSTPAQHTINIVTGNVDGNINGSQARTGILDVKPSHWASATNTEHE